MILHNLEAFSCLDLETYFVVLGQVCDLWLGSLTCYFLPYLDDVHKFFRLMVTPLICAQNFLSTKPRLNNGVYEPSAQFSLASEKQKMRFG